MSWTERQPHSSNRPSAAMAVKRHHLQVASQAAKLHKGAGQSQVEEGERTACELSDPVGSLAFRT